MSNYQPPQPLPPQQPKKKARKAAGFSCLGILGLFVILAIIGNLIDDDTEETAKPAPAATTNPAPEPSKQPSHEESEPPKASDPSETPETQEPTKKPEKKPEKKTEGAPVFPGASVEAWAKTLGATHRITYSQAAQPQPKLEGVEDRLKWFGETKGDKFSDPSYVASAVTNTDKKILAMTCAVANIPDGDSSGQTTFLADCVNAAGTTGADPAKVTAWVKEQLPAMAAKGGMQLENAAIGPLSLRLNHAGGTAQMAIEPKD